MTPQQEHAAILTAWAQDPSPTSLGPVFATVGDWASANAAHLASLAPAGTGERAPRDMGQFAPRKAVRAVRAVLPSWALAAFTVCLAVPGPLDEAAAILAALVLVVARFPRAASAWRGGKTERKAGGR